MTTQSSLITVTLPSKRKKKVYQLTHHQQQQQQNTPAVSTITNDPKTREKPVIDETDKDVIDDAVKEWRKRDETIARLYSSCLYKVGDHIYPATQEAYDKFGECVITGICKSYREFAAGRKGTALEWPKDDNPHIITIRLVNKPNAYAYVPVNWIGSVKTTTEIGE